MDFVKSQSLFLTVLAVLGLALTFSTVFSTAFSQSEVVTRGPYMIAGGDKMMVWRIDQTTGKVSYCMRDSVSMDPKFIQTRAPYCSAWSY